jgi:cytochrome c biogenesis protein CcmG/thiol:disulfide interchange protein DsbE
MSALRDEPPSSPRIEGSPAAGNRQRILAIGRWSSILIVLAFVALLALGLRNRNASQPLEGMAAPDFTLPLFGGYEAGLGSEVRLSSLRGQVVVLNFWASWCVTCRDEQLFLEQIWQRYKDKGVIVLGVDYVDTEPAARAYLQEFGVSYPNGPDLKTKISSLYRIRGVPETFVLDKSGQIVLFRPMPFSTPALQAELVAAIEQALGKSK